MDKKILLYVGTLEQRRNPLFLLEIVKHLPENFVLLIVGDGNLREKVARQIELNQLQNRCILLGKRNQLELPSLYMSADLFLLPSGYEIYGMVILEAMYFGLPVVSTKTAGAEVLISSGIDGVIMPNLQVSSWCDTIMELSMDMNHLKKMGEKAMRKIKNQFTWDIIADKFINLYFS